MEMTEKRGGTMQYTLMHKNIAVLDMELDEATSSIQRIDAVYRSEHLPVATASA